MSGSDLRSPFALLRRLWAALVAWHVRCLSDEEADWNRRYDEAMRWRDWQTCDQLLDERERRPWYRKEQRV